MKILFLLLIPVLVFGQSINYPDTLTLLNGEKNPCLITEIRKSNIRFIYGESKRVTMGFPGLEKVYVKGLGLIFDKELGLKGEASELNKIITDRNADEDFELNSKFPELKFHTNKNADFNGIAFGAYYLPYASQINSLVQIGNNYYYQAGYQNVTKMEAHLAVLFSKRMGLDFEVGFNSTYRKEVDKTLINYVDIYGEENIDGMKTLSLSINFKTYFNLLMKKKVTPFGLVGFGKHFTFIKDRFKDLSSNSNNLNEKKKEDFQEDLNSPYLINIGFGTEYKLDPSLTLVSFIRWTYMFASAKLDREIDSGISGINSSYLKYNISESVTIVGIGFNYYF